jgi:signal transduction histidine kinase/streptogramin lyase
MQRSLRVELIITLAIFTLAPSLLISQDPRFRIERISTREGFSQSVVYSMMQDHYGFIWFGTRDGLEKYDGYKFRSYRYDPFDTTSLSDYIVSAIAEDSSGYIWVGTYEGGLNRLDRHTGRCVRYHHDRRNPNSLSSDHIASLAVDRDGVVWVGTAGNQQNHHSDVILNRYDPWSNRFTQIPTDQQGGTGLPSGNGQSIYVDRHGLLWVCTSLYNAVSREGTGRVYLSRYAPATRSFRTWPIASTIGVMRIFGEQENGMLDLALDLVDTGSKAMLYRFDPQTGGVHLFDVLWRDAGRAGDRTFAPLMVDALGECWYVASAHVGNNRMRGPAGRFSLFCEPIVPFQTTGEKREGNTSARSAAAKHFSLPQPILICPERLPLRDRSGTLWFNLEAGAAKVSRIGAGFTSWHHNPTDSTALSARRIRSVQLDHQGRLWVGTDFGLNRYDSVIRGWRHYFANPLVPGSLPNSTVNVIHQDPNGRLLFGTNGGLVAYDHENDRFIEAFPALKWTERNAFIWSLLRDHQGNFWVGTSRSGVALLDSTGNLVQWFKHNENDPHSILDGGIWSILEDSRGTIWIGTNSGLCRWMPGSNRFHCYKHRPGDARSLGGDRIWDLHEDSDGSVWACAYGGGISRYNRASDDFTTITARDGLGDNSVFGLLEDDAHNFWIATTRGLVQWDRRANTFRHYDESDGLQGNEFAFKAMFKAFDGTLYFGGVDGLSAFKPAALLKNPFLPPLCITGFSIYDSLAAIELFDGDTVRLDHDQNFLSFEFAALDYINPAKNRYAFKLEGVDPQWTNTGSDHRVAGYTDLAPGTYTFVLRGTNSDGLWNERGLRVTVIIAPPWWGTWWFRVAVTALAVGFAAITLRQRTNRLRRYEREKREHAVQAALEMQEIERQRIARDLHDGVGQMLAAARVNLGRLRGMINRGEAEKPTETELHDSLERSIDILGRASDDVRSISHALGTSTLQELGLAAALGELLASMESEDRTRIEFVAVGMEVRLPEPIETGLFRVAQELITNVLRHAEATEATVQIVREDDEVRLSVEDNGIGFDPTNARNGMGHRNIATRVAAMGGALHYDSTPGHGTTVTVVVMNPRIASTTA